MASQVTSSEAAEAPPARRTVGLQIFASAEDEPRTRRSTDVVVAIGNASIVVIAALASRLLAGLEASFAEVVANIPGFFETLWRMMFWPAVVWSVILLVVAVARGRLALARDLLFAIVLAFLGVAAVAAIVMEDPPGLSHLLFGFGRPPVFPPGLVVLATAAISTASPHLTRPFRRLGSWLTSFQLIGAIMLGAALPSGAAAAIALGLLVAAAVHLAVGSPGGWPTASRIRLALADLGVEVDDLTSASVHREGIALFEATDDGGPLLVKVYGRDAGDAQYLASLWRRLWYRGAERPTAQSRIELVEHEGLVTLLAERAGAHVPLVVTAGGAGRGDALVVVRPIGDPVDASGDTSTTVDEAAVTNLWGELNRLHTAGINHRRIDLDRVVVTPERSLAFGDLSSATVAGHPDDAAIDRAQLLALSILLLDEERGVALARTFGDDLIVGVLPFVQEAAMPPRMRSELHRRKLELDGVRTRLATTLHVEEQPLIKLRRVTWGSLLNAALLLFAAFALISLLGGIDFDSFIDALKDANWWWLVLALFLAQVPRVPAAVSTMGALERPLPLGPLTTLQFAICYVNLAIPSSAARVALNIRFFQRFGVDATTAASAGVIDSVSGFVVQIGLFLTLFFWSDLDFGISFGGTDDLEGLSTIVLVVIAAIVVLAVLLIALPSWRRGALNMWHKATAALQVLRSPKKLVQSVGGNLLCQVLFAVALSACVKAFGYDLPLSSLVLINTVVSLFAGLLPIPGGMGVSEAGLTLGLTTAGIPSDTAFAIALAYRFASFYLPPIWGYVCYDWLKKKRYL